MGENRKTGKSQSAGPKRSRTTIGLLIGRLGDLRYQAYVWPGIAEVAEERDANLICFEGRELFSPNGFDSQRNVVYELVSPENLDGLDGLVILSCTMSHYIGPDQFRQFYTRFRPLPMVSIALPLDGVPSVLVDNSTGMRDEVAHLIQVHHCRRIAFIRGPNGHPEAEERYQAYAQALKQHGLPLDPDLVAPGDFDFSSGTKAIRLLLDQRKVKFEAVVTANDEMALGALELLEERGIRVPDDVAVTGFDDIEEASFSPPPLTTVRQPLHGQGRRAAEMLFALLAGEKVPDQVTLPAELVVRQSCRCFPQTVIQAETISVAGTGGTLEATLAAQRERILLEMAPMAVPRGVKPGWAAQLLDAFAADLAGNSPSTFLPALGAVLRQVAALNGDVASFQSVVSVLRRHILPYLAAGEALSRAENIWQQARVLIGENAQWAQARQRMQMERLAVLVSGISESLMTTFDLDGLPDAAARELPQIGIKSCYLSLYEQPVERDQKTPPKWSRLILAYNEQGRVELEPGGRRFPTWQLAPRGVLPPQRRFAMVVEPLRFRDEAMLGFVLFEPLQQEGGTLREMLSRQISTALRGALLLQDRKRAEETLRVSEQAERRFQERLRTLLEASNELSRAGSVDALCRQAVELSQTRLGFDRMGIWLRSPDSGFIVGTYGIDKDGNLRDDRGTRLQSGDRHQEIMSQKRPLTLLWGDVDLYDGQGNVVGRGARAQAAMWDGEQVIGFVSMDNLLRRQPITVYDSELLNLYASTLGYLCTRKRAEEELEKYSQRLEEMVEERTRELRAAQTQLIRREKLAILGQLAATVSHELRNPLATIRVSASSLDRKIRDQGLGAERSLDRIQRNITRCDNIISELLDYARMPELNLQTVPLDDWLNQLLDELILPKGITLVREVAGGGNVLMDPERFRRVIINLVDNARQAMLVSPDTGTKALVLSVQSGPDADRLRITITDNGPGIAPDVMPHIFEPLYSTKGFGAGLGLPVVKGIVEQHGGEIEITSQPGLGTQAVVWLPAIRQGA